jgi:outer membrane protein assembly factor BamB
VIEVSPDKKIVWKYTAKGEFQSCQRLDNGNTVIGFCSASKVLEVDKEGKEVIEFKVNSKVKNSHKIMRRVRKGSDGLYYVAHHGDGFCRVYDKTGKQLREIEHYKGFCYSAIPLKNGNVLLSGKELMKIVNPKNEIVWSIKPSDIPKAKIFSFCGAHILDNGNIVVSNWLGHGKDGKGSPIVEISPDKKVVWTFDNTKLTKHVLGVQVLD